MVKSLKWKLQKCLFLLVKCINQKQYLTSRSMSVYRAEGRDQDQLKRSKGCKHQFLSLSPLVQQVSFCLITINYTVLQHDIPLLQHNQRKSQLQLQFSSVAQSCLTLCNSMNCSMSGLPVHHQLPESSQTHVHRVSDAIQPSHPLSSPSPPAPNPSQHQSLFQ